MAYKVSDLYVRQPQPRDYAPPASLQDVAHLCFGLTPRRCAPVVQLFKWKRSSFTESCIVFLDGCNHCRRQSGLGMSARGRCADHLQAGP